MALRWLITEFLTGDIVQECDVVSPSLTLGLDSSGGSVDVAIGHMIRANESLDLIRARSVLSMLTPGRYCLACLDMEDDEAWGGAMDRVIGEWRIIETTPTTNDPVVPVQLSGFLDYTDDVAMAAAYKETGHVSWIVSDLLTRCFQGVQVTIPKPTLGDQIPVDWEAGKQTYGDAIDDVQRASGLEVVSRHTLTLTNGTPSRVVRSVEMGLPISNLNVYRVIDAGSNGISVSQPRSLDLWASQVRVYGAGSGSDKISGVASRTVPAGMPPVSRIFTDTSILTNSLAAEAAAQYLAEHTGTGPLQVTALRENWTNKFPSLGSRHRVVVDPCLAFPDGIDGQYRIVRIDYQPPDGQGRLAPDTIRLQMEEA